jgi:hypothetical protein
MSDSPAAIIFDETGANAAGVDAQGRVSILDPQTVREADVYASAFFKEAVAATSYFMLLDLDGAPFPHTSGSKAKLMGVNGNAFKDNAGAKWAVNLCVISRIDGTDADFFVIEEGSLFLRDTSSLSLQPKATQFRVPLDLEISGGALIRGVTNLKETNVAALNTGITLEDPTGATPTPAVGDLIIRTRLVSGGGTLDFAMGIQYIVES